MERLLLTILMAGSSSRLAALRPAGEESGTPVGEGCQIVVWGSILNKVALYIEELQ